MTVDSDYQAVSAPIKIAAAARVLGISKRHLRHLVDKGFIRSTGKWGGFVLPEVVQDYVRWIKNERPPRDEQRSELRSWQQKKIELQISQALGHLLPSSMISDLLQEYFTETAALLEAAPGRLANELAGVHDPAIARQLLQDETRRIREALAKRLERTIEVCRASGSVRQDPASAPEAQPVAVGGDESSVPPGERGAGPLPSEANAVLHPDPGRRRRSTVQRHRRGNGDANGEDNVVPQRRRAKAR